MAQAEPQSEEDTQAQARRTDEIPQWKREEVAELESIIEGYDSVGVVSIAGIPSRQLQDMRRNLHGEAQVRVSRNTLLRRALESTGREELVEHVSGQVGIIGTDSNPFTLFRQLEASKTPAPIAAGEIAPNDIVIPEGDTGVSDGQFIGDLKQAGVDSRFMDGSVQVTEETVALEAGGEVSPQLANVLSTLGIEPKEVGLDLRAVLSEGVVFDPEDLDIDVEAYREDLVGARSRAFNLAVNAAIPARGAVESILGRAAGDARAVGLAGSVPEPGLVGDLLARADGNLRALAASVDDDEALPEELQDVEDVGHAEETEDDEAGAGADDAEDAEDDPEAEEPEEDDDEDDEDDDGAGAGLGNMFGD